MNWALGLDVFDYSKWTILYLLLAGTSFFLGLLGFRSLEAKGRNKSPFVHGLYVVFVCLVPLCFLAIVEICLFSYTQSNDRWRQLYANFSAYGDVSALRPFMDDRSAYRGRRQDGLGIADLKLYWPVQSDLYSVNTHGFRAPEFSEKKENHWRVGILGGSTTWGSWVRDEETIPGIIGKQLQLSGILTKDVVVFNLGVEGAGIDVEVQIAKKLYPLVFFDQLIFYDGVNDFPDKYLHWKTNRRNFSNVSGTQQGDVEARSVSNPLLHEANLANRLILKLTDFEIVQTLRYLIDKARLTASSVWPVQLSDEEFRYLVDVSVADYLSHYDNAMHLCEEKTIRCDFFIQPFVAHKKLPTSAEIRIRNYLLKKTPDYVRHYDAVADEVLASHKGNIWDLRNALDDVDGEVFADSAHMTKLGNNAIAKGIVRRLWGVINN